MVAYVLASPMIRCNSASSSALSEPRRVSPPISTSISAIASRRSAGVRAAKYGERRAHADYYFWKIEGEERGAGRGRVMGLSYRDAVTSPK
jgi:hypothetical protein